MTTTGNISTPVGQMGVNYGISQGNSSVDTKSDKDMFLKLLVAQMRYQDPSKPTDASQFLAQTAQFTLVEKLENLQKSQAAVAQTTQLQAATGMVGTTVSYSVTDDAGNTATKSGVVSAVTVTADGTPKLTVGTDDVELAAVTKVSKPGT
jgi:flagellar basal-body rod modification protein FlgD